MTIKYLEHYDDINQTGEVVIRFNYKDLDQASETWLGNLRLQLDIIKDIIEEK